MKVHHGKTIEIQVVRSGKKRQEIAKQLGVTRQTFANKLNTPNLSIDFIFRVGKILGYDFSRDIPEMKQFQQSMIHEPTESYGQSSFTADEEEQWKEKYLKLMENYVTHLQQKEDVAELLIKAINDLKGELKHLILSSPQKNQPFTSQVS